MADDTTTDDRNGGEAIHDVGGVPMTAAEMADADLFLDGPRGGAWFDRLMSGVYHTAWYRDRSDSVDRSSARDVAEAILEARRAGEPAVEAVEEHFGHGRHPEDDYEEQAASEHRDAIEALAADAAELADEEGVDLPGIDVETWIETVRERAVDRLADEDDSSPFDMLCDHDRVEIAVRLAGGDGTLDMARMNGGWADVVVDGAFQRTLAATGHRVADYRRHSGNRRTWPRSGVRGGVERRPSPLASLDDLRELVENAGGSPAIVLYAYVRIADLVELDPNAAFALDRCEIAAWDNLNGTYHGIEIGRPTAVAPGQGRIEVVRGYGPDDVCGFVMSCHEATIANLDAAAPRPIEGEAADDGQGEMRLAFAPAPANDDARRARAA